MGLRKCNAIPVSLHLGHGEKLLEGCKVDTTGSLTISGWLVEAHWGRGVEGGGGGA